MRRATKYSGSQLPASKTTYAKSLPRRTIQVNAALYRSLQVPQRRAVDKVLAKAPGFMLEGGVKHLQAASDIVTLYELSEEAMHMAFALYGHNSNIEGA